MAQILRLLLSRTPKSFKSTLRRAMSTQTVSTSDETGASSPVWSYNEWDPLQEMIVGRPEGATFPFMHPDFKAKHPPVGWQFLQENQGQPFDPVLVKLVAKEVDELCRVLIQEGVTVRRAQPTPWSELGCFTNPSFKDWGCTNSFPRDTLLVVGNEIIETAAAWRSRAFEVQSYRKLLNEYFHKGARWSSAPKPLMGDDLYDKDFPYENEELRLKMNQDGKFILTEAEVAFDAADCMRFGRDIFITITNTTNRAGVKWLRRHLESRGIRVHSLIYEDLYSCHADVTLIPLRPGVLLVCPDTPCRKINDEPASWDYFSKRGWKVVEAPNPITVHDTPLSTKWLAMNIISLDTERVIIPKGEEPLRQLLVKLGFKPIEVDFQEAFTLGGGFHCWTLDVKRRGKLESYF